MTDRERLLLMVATVVHPRLLPTDERDPDVAKWTHDPPKPGDVVRCVTSGAFRTHPWVIGWWVESLPDGGGLLRELGGKRTCSVTNEMFWTLRGVPSWKLLEGFQHRMLEQVRGAIRRLRRKPAGADYHCLFAGLTFDGPRSRVAHVSIRPHAFLGDTSRRYTVDFEIGRRLPAQRDIADAIWTACPWRSA